MLSPAPCAAAATVAAPPQPGQSPSTRRQAGRVQRPGVCAPQLVIRADAAGRLDRLQVAASAVSAFQPRLEEGHACTLRVGWVRPFNWPGARCWCLCGSPSLSVVELAIRRVPVLLTPRTSFGAGRHGRREPFDHLPSCYAGRHRQSVCPGRPRLCSRPPIPPSASRFVGRRHSALRRPLPCQVAIPRRPPRARNPARGGLFWPARLPGIVVAPVCSPGPHAEAFCRAIAASFPPASYGAILVPVASAKTTALIYRSPADLPDFCGCADIDRPAGDRPYVCRTLVCPQHPPSPSVIMGL